MKRTKKFIAYPVMNPLFLDLLKGLQKIITSIKKEF